MTEAAAQTPQPADTGTLRVVNPQTGQPYDMAPAEALQAWRKGAVAFQAGSRVAVRLPGGKTGTVPAEQLQSAVDLHGAELLSDQAHHAAQVELKAGGAAGAALAFGKGLAGEGSPLRKQAVSKALELAGVAPATQATEARTKELEQAVEKEHPYAKVGGELTRVALGSVMPIPGAAAVEGAVLGGRTGMAAKAAATAARAAYEQQLFTADQIRDAAMRGDPDLTAQKVIATVGLNTLLAGGFGAGFSLAGDVASKGYGALRGAASSGLSRAVDAIASRAAGRQVEGAGEKVVRLGLNDADKVYRSELLDAEKIREAAARRVVDHVNDMVEATDAVVQEGKGALKLNQIRALVPEGREAAAKAGTESLEHLGGLHRDLAEIEKDPAMYGVQRKIVQNLRATVEDTAPRVVEAVRAGDAGKAYKELDDLKRAIGTVNTIQQRSLARATANPLFDRAGRALFDRTQELYSGLQSFLEKGETWGKMGDAQTAINRIWTEQIPASREFNSALTRSVEIPGTYGARKPVADPAKVAAYVRNVVNPERDLVHKFVTDRVRLSQELADTMGKFYELGPEARAQLSRLKQTSEAFRGTLDHVEKVVGNANAVEGMLKLEAQEHGSQALGAVLGGGLGAIIGHPVAGAVTGAKVGGFLGRPAHLMMQQAQLERAVAKSDSLVARSVRGFLGGEPKAGRVPMLPAAEYDRRAATYRSLATSPERAIEATAKATEPIRKFSPSAAVAMASAMGRGIEFLSSKLPPTPVQDPLGAEPRWAGGSAGQREKWLRYTRAVERPLTLVEDLRHGQVTPEAVEAVRTVYPDLYDHIRNEIMSQVSDGKHQFTVQQRIALGVLFDLPTDSSLQPATLRANQATYAAANAPAKPSPRPKPINLARVSALDARSSRQEQSASGGKS